MGLIDHDENEAESEKYIIVHRCNIIDLQSFIKYLRLTLVFMPNSALREKINFCFSRAFC